MTLTKKDRQEVAAMITRVVTATGAGPDVDYQAVENTAEEPEFKIMTDVKSIEIVTNPAGVSGFIPAPDAEAPTSVNVTGKIDGEVKLLKFGFPPGNATHLSELKRIQNHPHLFQRVNLFLRDRPTGERYIATLYLHYDATQ